MENFFNVFLFIIGIINGSENFSDLLCMFDFNNFILSSYVIKNKRKIKIKLLESTDMLIKIQYYEEDNKKNIISVCLNLQEDIENNIEKLSNNFNLITEKIYVIDRIVISELKQMNPIWQNIKIFLFEQLGVYETIQRKYEIKIEYFDSEIAVCLVRS